jgi:hypothetical protein
MWAMMKLRRALGLTVFAVVLASSFVPTTVEAQPRRGRGVQKKDPGQALFEAKDYAGAAADFEKSYAATKDPKALFMLARSLDEGGKKAAALRMYKKYLAEGSPTAAQSTEVLGLIQAATVQVAIVNVNAPDGSVISVDGTEVGKMPLADPLYVDPGKHTITAAHGGATASKTITAEEEGRPTVDLSPKGESAAPAVAPAPVAPPPKKQEAAPPPPAPAREPETSSGSSALTIVGFGGAGLLAVGSAFFAIKAAGTSAKFEEKKRELGVDRSEIDSLQGQERLQFGLSVGLGVSALALTGVTLFVFRKPTAEKSAASTSVIVTGNGAAFKGSF